MAAKDNASRAAEEAVVYHWREGLTVCGVPVPLPDWVMARNPDALVRDLRRAVAAMIRLQEADFIRRGQEVEGWPR